MDDLLDEHNEQEIANDGWEYPTMTVEQCEIPLEYKGETYYANVFWEVECSKYDTKVEILSIKVVRYVVSDENGEVDLPREEVFKQIPPLSEQEKVTIRDRVRRGR